MSAAKRPASNEGRRDPRFVTRRRGGLLEYSTHQALAVWAAACAEHVLGLYEISYPHDTRPRNAIRAARSWASGAITMTTAREAAYAAHAAARGSTGAASEAARAAGHAAATAHMADHELGPAYYALRALTAATTDHEVAERERHWQIEQLPDDIRDLVLDDMHRRAVKFKGAFRR